MAQPTPVRSSKRNQVLPAAPTGGRCIWTAANSTLRSGEFGRRASSPSTSHSVLRISWDLPWNLKYISTPVHYDVWVEEIGQGFRVTSECFFFFLPLSQSCQNSLIFPVSSTCTARSKGHPWPTRWHARVGARCCWGWAARNCRHLWCTDRLPGGAPISHAQPTPRH